MSSNSRKNPARGSSATKGSVTTTLQQFMDDKTAKGPKLTKDDPTPTNVMADHVLTSTDIRETDHEDLRKFIERVIQNQTEEICTKIGGIATRVEELEKAMEFTSAQIDEFRGKAERLDSVQTELQALKQRVLLSEIYSRKSNILIYGISHGVDNEELTDVVKDLFIRTLDLDAGTVAEMKFVNIHRLPVKKKRMDTPDSVIVKFALQQERDLVMQARFKAFKELSKRKIVLRTDLPPELKQRRAKLEAKSYTIRKELKMQTRIVERGATVCLQYRKSR